MTDFVLTQDSVNIFRYANFLKTPLQIGHFVPCDEDGNILEEPRMIERRIGFDETDMFWDIGEVECYKKAKERVLFDGFIFTESQAYSVANKINLSVSPYGLRGEMIQLTKLKENKRFHTWLNLSTIESLVQCDILYNATAQKLIYGK